MGAYLSEPVLEKHSSDEDKVQLSYGASSMQGWRVSQEDAHNSIIDYSKGKSFFAVYDGHGGHEVALYCSQKLPEFLKTNENYKKGNYKEALEEAFIAFDATLTDRTVVAELKKLMSNQEAEESEDENEGDEVSELFEEANMSIEDIVAKYTTSPSGKSPKAGADEAGVGPAEGPAKLVNPAIANMRKKEKKPLSPFLKAKSCPASADLSAGSNKHIRFNADGSVLENGVDHEVKEEVDATTDNIKSETNQELKTEVEEESKETPKTPSNGSTNGKAEVEDSPDGSEKENKDTNSLANGDIMDEEGNIIRGKNKGKGKGKGKSKGKSEDLVPDLDSKDKKLKKSANEIYETLLKPEVGSGDEDSEDSDDMEYGEAEGIEEEDSDECEDDVEEEEEESEEDSEEEEEDDEEEEGEPVEADFTEEPGNDSGCTAVVAMLAGTTLYVANAGDSRCVVSREGKAVEMSADHKPEDDIEMKRIKNAGGKVTADGRVNGGLNLSRAIGDHAYKQNKSLSLPEQMISPQPDLRTLEIDPEKDSWMILACDGIWNFMSSQEVVDYIQPKIDSIPTNKLSSLCEELFEHCLAPDTMGDGTGCDNMTAVIVKFKPDFKLMKDSLDSHENGVDTPQDTSEESNGPASKKMRLDTEASSEKA